MDVFIYIFSSPAFDTDVSVPTNEDIGNAGPGSGCKCIIAWEALFLIAYLTITTSLFTIVRLFLCIDQNILLIMSSASLRNTQHYRYHLCAIFGIYNWHIIETWTTAAQILDFQLQTAHHVHYSFHILYFIWSNCVFFSPGTQLATIHIPISKT